DVADYDQLFDELFPICRSITGPGLRDSLKIMARHMPLEIAGVPSGTKVLDWTVPPEWHIRSARLTDPEGMRVCDFGDSNLCVVNYSIAIDQTLPLEGLQPHLHSIPATPDLTPYVTSYYKENWGFCLPHNVREALKPGDYQVQIDAEKVNGELNFAECELPGTQGDVFLLSTYLCHPSMANNELSGPLVMQGLYHRIAAWPSRRYTYRFLIAPETIGSITYLSKMGMNLKDEMMGGLVLTCLGGPQSKLSYKASRRDRMDRPSAPDVLARHLASKAPEEWEVRDFTPNGGSDERQFCSPGFDLPMGQMARTVYGQYEEYHTSGDTKEFMDTQQIKASVDALETYLLAMEFEGQTLRNLSPYGEPQLGRRNLYPNMNSHSTRGNSSDEIVDSRTTLMILLNILSFGDGTLTLREMADKLGLPVTQMIPAALALEREQLLMRE
ncbi:MAG: DUF4910 domain-containing protein, partial [Pseudomonadota bacterium]